MLEPYDGKLSRTVLRREGGGNTADPADFLEKVTIKKETTLKKTLLVEKQITTHDGVTATNDVKAGTISLQQHKHTPQGLTSPTTPPIP